MEFLAQNKVGIVPCQENIPLVIDYNQAVGFDCRRNWQLRFVKDFSKTFALGISPENQRHSLLLAKFREPSIAFSSTFPMLAQVAS
jgi:hypothetical protein